jgi:hypothetical protein
VKHTRSPQHSTHTEQAARIAQLIHGETWGSTTQYLSITHGMVFQLTPGRIDQGQLRNSMWRR